MPNSSPIGKLVSYDKHLNLYRTLPIIALLFVTIGTGLRFYNLENKLVWHDEVLTLARILGFKHEAIYDGVHNAKVQTSDQLLRFQRQTPANDIGDIWNAIKEHPEHSPLYYILAGVVVHEILPESPVFAMRATAALLSLLLFPAFFWLVWEWSRNRNAAWIAVTLVAVSPLHLLYAQEAREYALLVVLMTMASAALLYALRRQTYRTWWWYGFILILGLYTHLLFVHTFLAHVMYLVWSAWKTPNEVPLRSVKYAAITTVAALIALIPWLLVLFYGRDDFHTFTKWMGDKVISITELMYNWTLHLRRPFIDIPSLEPIHMFFVLIILFVLWQELRNASAKLNRFIACLAAPVLLTVVLPDLAFGGIRSVETRYLMQILIVLDMVVAFAIAQFLVTPNKLARYAAYAGFAAFLILGVASEITISHADSWWNKGFSQENAAFAELVNQSEHPLVLWSGNAECGFCQGELISLSHKLTPSVHMLGMYSHRLQNIPPGYSDLFLLFPQEKLLTELKAAGYEVSPFSNSWKWFTTKPGLVAYSEVSQVGNVRPLKADSTILYDDFSTSPMNANLWHLPSCLGNVDANYVGRTNFRCIEQHPLPEISQGNALITIESYNPNDPTKLYGTDLMSNQMFTVDKRGISIKVRAKLSTPIPRGVVAGIFLYALKPGTDRINTAHDEIDFELLGNNPNLVATNVYGNEQLGIGHPLSFPYKSGSMADYHTYEVQWLPDRVAWLVDGKLVRTDTDHVPTSPMYLHINLWVPSVDWGEAYSSTIKPTHSPEENRIIVLSVDEVSINRMY